MQGLRTKENNKFLNFFKKVQESALKMNKVFFLDAGECLDIEFDNMVVDEMSGWLIPLEDVVSFELKFNKNMNLDEFENFYIWVIPTIKNQELSIEFKNF